MRILIVHDDFQTTQALCTLAVREGHQCLMVKASSEIELAAADFRPDMALLNSHADAGQSRILCAELRSISVLTHCRMVAMSEDRSLESDPSPFDVVLIQPSGFDEFLDLLDLFG
ncbi:hypothetical protein LMG24235_04521 [Paraburkholderia sabiae]|nr:hypothetical protein LMG24235_04521 [Paraburkholderia sabiae]